MDVQSTVSKKAPWHDAFFDQPRLTSKLKHCILEAYVKEFAYHLGSARPTVYYVDGFAGPGGYRRPTGEFEPGSPVLIAQFAEHLRATTAPFTVKCLNVEADRERHRQLVDATAAFTGAIIEQNYCAPFMGVLGDILRRVGDAPAFFFLDPFGTKGLPFRDLLPLFRRVARTEVLITLHTDGIAKKAGWFASLDDADPQKRKTALALTEHLAKAPVCFYLVFGTQHQKGLYEMNDCMAPLSCPGAFVSSPAPVRRDAIPSGPEHHAHRILRLCRHTSPEGPHPASEAWRVSTP
jgi:three-Cys-motif partner protein